MLSLLLLTSFATQDTRVAAARAVLQRTFGDSAKSFDLKLEQGTEERFTVEAKNGRVSVTGTSPVAICRGAYEYAKNACNVQVSWSTETPPLPKRLPDYTKRTGKTPHQYRHYFNVCTFGYTMAWWNWARWEKEIDWMALHGINMPLAMTGQEKVWQKVFREFNVPEESIRKHFTGPAFLPWHRMGNVNSHAGPLPQSWIDGQAELQKQILQRERSLGMKPVVPGFSGFVPVDFDKYNPGVRLDSPQAWAGFEPTKFVDVRSPMFVEIGKKFVEEYRKEFGTDHLYLCDTFNEQDPKFPEATKLADLAAAGKAVYEALRQGDPEAVWVMQGWLFYNSQQYWKAPETSALLSQVPAGKMIILDLATTEHEVWKRLPAVRDTGWIFNTLHNYGQSTNLQGNLQHYADRVYETMSNPEKGRMLGMGLTMEGIDQNPVVYELMTDLMWTDEKVDVQDWLKSYARSRYGASSPNSEKAWGILRQQIYSKDGAWEKATWRQRPRGGAGSEPRRDPAQMKEAVRLLLADAGKFKNNDIYRRDLVDVTKTWLSDLADINLLVALNMGSYDGETKFQKLLFDIDALLASRPEHRLSTWIEDARKWGKTEAEKDLMEENARLQVTVWGGPYLADYANKEWSGLIATFIAQRWVQFFEAGKSRALIEVDYPKWEIEWTRSADGGVFESAHRDSIEVAKELFEKYKGEETSVEKLMGEDKVDKGIAVGKPARDSGGTEGTGVASLAVDGSIFGSWWAASPAPQWLEIDLEKVERISGVYLYPYRGDRRYYQYKIEVSTDGKEWKQVVDASMNENLATIRGYRHAFSPTEGRYVRVTMLKNSANIGVHLHEVRVFRAGG